MRFIAVITFFVASFAVASPSDDCEKGLSGQERGKLLIQIEDLVDKIAVLERTVENRLTLQKMLPGSFVMKAASPEEIQLLQDRLKRLVEGKERLVATTQEGDFAKTAKLYHGLFKLYQKSQPKILWGISPRRGTVDETPLYEDGPSSPIPSGSGYKPNLRDFYENDWELGIGPSTGRWPPRMKP